MHCDLTDRIDKCLKIMSPQDQILTDPFRHCFRAVIRTISIGTIAVFANIACSLASVPTSQAQTPVTVLQNEISYDVHADGTFVMEQLKRVRVNDGRGIAEGGQLSHSFSASLETFKIIEAYTTNSDGRDYKVTSDGILTQQSPQVAGAPMFDDMKVRTVVFPRVGVGSVLTLRTRRTQEQSLFPGVFSTIGVFNATEDIRSAQVTLRAPKSLTLFIDAIGLEGGEVIADQSDIRTWRWSLTNTNPHPFEGGSISVRDFSPRLAVTGFPHYAAAAEAYLMRARPKAKVTAAVQKLADEITRGIADKRSQAEEIYYWVSTHIRYLAIFLDFGGVVPHDADAILNARYGDCKDHVTLLESLLAAKGIRSSPVLVNNGNAYRIPRVASMPGNFNHAISYLPDFDLFVDSTAAIAQFGVLPSTERGKPALLTDDGQGNAKLVTLPLSTPSTDQVHVANQFTIDVNGTVVGKGNIQSTGVFDIVARTIFAGVAKGLESQLAANALSASRQTGSGTYTTVGKPWDLTREFSLDTEVTLPNYANIPGPGALVVPLGLVAMSNIPDVFSSANLATRNFPIAIAGGQYEEITTLRFPDTVAIKALPKPSQFANAFGRYISDYAIQNNTVTVKRVLELSPSNPVIEPKDYADFRAMGVAVSRDFRGQIIYE